jgi:hypothetical protein
LLGLKSRRREWSRPPEPSPDASGILVQPIKRRPDVSLKRHRKRAGSCKRAQTLDTEQRPEIYHGILIRTS